MELTPEQLAEYELRATMAERKRCATIVEQRAALWQKRVEADVHGECAMSLLEECDEIAAAIRNPKSE